MNGNVPEIYIKRSRRKTMSVEITDDMKVLVRAPYGLPEREIERFIASSRSWI